MLPEIFDQKSQKVVILGLKIATFFETPTLIVLISTFQTLYLGEKSFFQQKIKIATFATIATDEKKSQSTFENHYFCDKSLLLATLFLFFSAVCFVFVLIRIKRIRKFALSRPNGIKISKRKKEKKEEREERKKRLF